MNADILKNAMKQSVDQTEPSEARRVFYSLRNIEAILHQDIIQQILSFNHSLSMKSVSKTFKRCFIKNENIKLRERELEIKSELNITQNNQTWIVYPSHQVDEQKKENDSIYTLNDALNKAESGDTILMNDGQYTLDDDHIYIFNKDMQMIGIGDNVIIQFPQNMDILHLKKLKLYMLDDGADGIELEQYSSLWMEKCEIHNGFHGIIVGDNANLCATNCIFKGPSNYQAIAVKTSTNYGTTGTSILILNCIFINCGSKDGEPCITIPNGRYCDFLTLNGNWFKNMKGFPIGLSSADIEDLSSADIFPSLNEDQIICRLNKVSFRDEGLLRYLEIWNMWYYPLNIIFIIFALYLL